MEKIPESSYNVEMEYKRQSNAIYKCEYHMVLTTKYRRKIFRAGVFEYFKIKIEEIRKRYPEIEILEVNHERDHIHLMLSIPPKMSVGGVVRILKSNTARGMKKRFEFLKGIYWGMESIWSSGYFVSKVGTNEKVILEYIKMQGREDFGQAKLALG